MKVDNNNINYKILLKMLDGQVNNISNEVGKEKNNPTGKQEILEQTTSKNTSSEILNLLGKLNEQDRKILISSLINYNLPIDTEKIEKLVSYLQNKADKDNGSLIKSFILLMKNNIPINKSLLEGIAANFKQNNSLSDKLNNLLNVTEIRENIATKKDNPLLSILKQLIIDPSNREETLIDQLKEYPEKVSKSIQLLQEQSNNSQQKVMQHLIGQQLINHEVKNLLLNLEIPIFFPQYKKFIPAYLNIRRDSNSDSRDKDSLLKNYKINFIISLEKRGIIKAETYMSTGRIKILFTCNKKDTMELIDSEFIGLKESLESIGIRVENPSIKCSNLNSEDINNNLNDNIGIEGSQNSDFLHIDIKV